MLEDALTDLKVAFQSRTEPRKWVRDDLHPVDALDATDFIADIQAGKDRALLFQSAIPYFAFLTDDARFFLLPDYLGTIAKYESHVITAVSDLDDERGRALLASLTPAEAAAVSLFITALSRSPEMQFYAKVTQELASLLEESRTMRSS
jgi:hypothetical protein